MTPDLAAQPSPASRWSPVAAYATVSAANQMLWLTYAPITTDAAHHYGVSVSAIGWLAEIFPLVYVVLALPTGRVIDRWLRGGLGVGAGLTALGALVRLTGDSYPVILLGQLLVAVAQPFVLNAVTKLSGAYLQRRDRATGIAVSSAGIFAGLVLALLTGTVAGIGHLSALLVFQAAFAVLGAGWLLVALRRPGSTSALQTGFEVKAAGVLEGVRIVLRNRPVVLLVVMASGGFGVFVAMTTWLQALLEPAGVSESEAGTLLLVMVVAGVVGSALLPAPLARRGMETRFMFVSVIAAALACSWLALRPGFVQAVPAVLLLGILLLTDLPLILELVERRAGDSAGMATALLWMAGNLGGLLLALVVQALVPVPAVAFLVMGAALLALLPALARLRTLLTATATAVPSVDAG